MQSKREVSSDEEELRIKVASYGNGYAKRFLDYFDSLDFDHVEVVRNKHPVELFPALRGVVCLDASLSSFDPHNFYSYEIGFHPNSNDVWMNVFQGLNHHNPKFSARFGQNGLKLVSRFSGMSLEEHTQYTKFQNIVNNAYHGLYSSSTQA